MRGLVVIAACAPATEIELPSDHPSHLLVTADRRSSEVSVFALERSIPIAVNLSDALDLALLSFDEPLGELGLEPGPIPVGPGRALPVGLAESLRFASLDDLGKEAWAIIDELDPPFSEVQIAELSLEVCLARGGCFSRVGVDRVCKPDCNFRGPSPPIPPEPPKEVAPPSFGSCPEGWDAIESRGCALVLPDPPDCANPREAAFYGSSACTPLDRPCTPPMGPSVLRVPADYGSIAGAAAVARSGEVIHVEGGTYGENVVLDAGVALIGCPEATLTGSGGIGVRVDGAGARIEGVIIEGFDEGIRVVASASATIADVTIDGASSGGLVVDGAADAARVVIRNTPYAVAYRAVGPSSIREAVIENAARIGIQSQGAQLSIARAAIRTAEIGMDIHGPASLDAVEIRGVGTAVFVVGAAVDIADLFIRSASVGVDLHLGASVQITGVDLEASAVAFGAATGSTLAATFANVDMRGTGAGVVSTARFESRKSRIERSYGRAVLATGGTILLEDFIVDDVVPDSMESPRLIELYRTEGVLERVELLGRGYQTGVLVADGSSLDGIDVLGVGLDLLAGGAGRVHLSRARTSFGSALNLFDTATASVSDLDVVGAEQDLLITLQGGAALELRRARLWTESGVGLAVPSARSLLLEDVDIEVERSLADNVVSGIDIRHSLEGAPSRTIHRARVRCPLRCVEIRGAGDDFSLSDLSVTSGGTPFRAVSPIRELPMRMEIQRAELIATGASVVAIFESIGALRLTDVRVDGGQDGVSIDPVEPTVGNRVEISGSTDTCLTVEGEIDLGSAYVHACGTGIAIRRETIPNLRDLEVEGTITPVRFISR